MKKTILIIILLFSSLAQGQFWENPNQKPSLFGMRINRGHILGDSVVCWLFSEGFASKVYDLSGNRNTGILQANASWDAGFIVCEANGDKIISPTTGFGQAGTIIFSFNGTGTPNGWGVFVSVDAQTNFCIMRANSTTAISFYVNGGSVTLGGTASWGTGEHILAFTWDASTNTRKRYDDGVLSDTDTTAFTAPTYGSNFHWGDRGDSTRTIGGRFGWISGYNRVLSASEIVLLYREPFCYMEPNWDMELYGWMTAPPVGAGQFIYINMN